MTAHWKGILWATGVVALSSGLAGCNSEVATASVEGRLGAPARTGGKTEQAMRAQGAAATGVSRMERALVVDSSETSLDGIRLELVEWRAQPTLHEVGVVDTVAADDTGRFAFPEVPVMSPAPPDNGQFVVNILQPEDTLVSYGAGGSFVSLAEGEILSLSLPVVTRLQLPLWVDSTNPPPPEQGFTEVQLAADSSGSRLVFFTPHRGLGIYDPARATVDVLRATKALDFTRADSRVHVLEQTGQVLLSLVSGSKDARFILVDLDIFTDPSLSEFVDLDDSATATQLADRVTIIDVPADANPPEEPARDFYDIALRPKSAVSSDGRRFYLAELGSTFVIDLENRSFVNAWHDTGYLGAYNAQNGHLYFDMPDGVLRLRDAASGELVRDLDIGARSLLGIAAFPDQPNVIVSYESASTPLEHRIAVIGADGTVASDHLAGEYLGFVDRYWDAAYAWGTCGPEFYQGAECPECPPLATDLPFPDGIAELHHVDMFFDAIHNRLVMPHFGASFEFRDDAFYPMPFLMCSRFAMPDECTGHAYHDALNQVALIQSLSDASTTCIMHTDGSDLTIPVKISGGHSGFSTPVVLPSLGIGFVASNEALTAIHYNNSEAASQPAVRDLRGEISLP